MIALAALACISLLSGTVLGGTKVWDGSFDAYSTVADFDKCKVEQILPQYILLKRP